MKRPLPLWLSAVVPATLAGHGLAYALAGRTTADGHHGWMQPVLECSLALLIAAALFCVGESLLKARILTLTAAERSWAGLCLRMALCQTLLFSVMEYAEGGHAGIAGVLVQIALALVAAYLLSLFSHMLVACARGTQEAARYLLRLLRPVSSFFTHRPVPLAQELAVRAGRSRFQRPPPRSIAFPKLAI